MFRFILILLVFICSNLFQNAYCVNIVYPKSDNVTINSDKTFFIGNENPAINLTINGKPVAIHPCGGFKHTVYLNYGVNKFVISNGAEEKIYQITRPQNSKSSVCENQIITYEKPIIIKIKEDNSPLRSSPVDSGLNRLQHLNSGIELQAIGEYGNFYKVLLSRDDIAWINKSNVEKVDKLFLNYANVEKIDYKKDGKSEIYTFKLNSKVPYVLSEDGLSGFTLVIYNMNSELYPFGRYEYQILHEGKNFGYSSQYNDNNELIVKVNKYPSSLKGLNITIDAGHGGSEFGAIGCLGDKEKDLNLQIANKLKLKLQSAGANVFMTRENDIFLGLDDRVKFSNENNTDIFISIHNNALPDSLADKDASGTEVYYFYSQSRYLAKVISAQLSKNLGFKNRGAKGGSFAVIRNTNSLAVLVEVGFLINPEENYLLIDNDFQDKAAEGILNGLNKYFDEIDMEIINNK